MSTGACTDSTHLCPQVPAERCPCVQVKLGQTQQVLTPLEVTTGLGLLVAVLGFTGAMLTLRQRARSDRHTAWWVRAQWAIDVSSSADPETRSVGFEAMTVLGRDTTASAADLEVLDVAFTRRLDSP